MEKSGTNWKLERFLHRIKETEYLFGEVVLSFLRLSTTTGAIITILSLFSLLCVLFFIYFCRRKNEGRFHFCLRGVRGKKSPRHSINRGDLWYSLIPTGQHTSCKYIIYIPYRKEKITFCPLGRA